MKIREKLARWLFPSVFSERDHLSYEVYSLRLDRDYERVLHRMTLAGRRLPMVMTLGELKSILPAGIRVDETVPGTLMLAVAYPPGPDPSAMADFSGLGCPLE